MNRILSRVRGAFLYAAAACAAVVVCVAQPAAASEMTATHTAGITVTGAQARIVNVYRSRAATGYERVPARLSEEDFDWAPSGYRDVVNVVVEIADPYASPMDGDESAHHITLQIDVSQLTAQQMTALSSRRMSERLAAFQLNAEPTSTMVRRINYARSSMCSGDEFRCEDQIVFEDARVESVRLSVA